MGEQIQEQNTMEIEQEKNGNIQELEGNDDQKKQIEIEQVTNLNDGKMENNEKIEIEENQKIIIPEMDASNFNDVQNAESISPKISQTKQEVDCMANVIDEDIKNEDLKNTENDKEQKEEEKEEKIQQKTKKNDRVSERKELLKFTKSKLAKICRESHIASNGTKGELVDRLLSEKEKKTEKKRQQRRENKKKRQKSLLVNKMSYLQLTRYFKIDKYQITKFNNQKISTSLESKISKLCILSVRKEKKYIKLQISRRIPLPQRRSHWDTILETIQEKVGGPQLKISETVIK